MRPFLFARYGLPCPGRVGAFLTTSHRGASDETSRKKKQLNEAEIALRREETARKRKHLSEKKLEDEKVRFPPPLYPVLSSLNTRFSYEGGDDQPSPEKEVWYAK